MALFQQTVGTAVGEAAPAISLEDIDAMEPREFERWAAQRLRTQGWEVRNPPQTRDGGADVVGRRNGRTTLVQCKHSSTPAAAMDRGVDDLLRAIRAYGEGDLVLLSNAKGFTRGVVEAAVRNTVRLVGRESLLFWP